MTRPVLSLFPGLGLLDEAFSLEGWCVVRGPDPIWGGDIRVFHPPPGWCEGIIGGPPRQMFSPLSRLLRAMGREPTFGDLIPEFERCVREAQPDWFLMENVPQAPVAVVPGYSVTAIDLNNAWIAGADGFGQEQERKRRFCFGVKGPGPAPNLRRWIPTAALLLPVASEPVTTERKRARAATRSTLDNTVDYHRERRLHRAVVASDREVPVAIGGSGRVKRSRRAAVTSSDGGGSVQMARYSIADMLRLQGLPENWLDHCPMTADGKRKAIANGVPLPMGRAVARSIRGAIEEGRQE